MMIYIFVDEIDSYNIYKIDIIHQECSKVYDLTKCFLNVGDLNYLTTYNDSIYFPCEDKLLKYTPELNNLEEIQLPFNNAWGLYIQGDTLYISCVDVFNDDSQSDIIVYDLSTMTFISTYHLEEAIMQFSVVDDILYVLGDSVLCKYKITLDNQCTLLSKVTLESSSKNYHISAIFPSKLN